MPRSFLQFGYLRFKPIRRRPDQSRSRQAHIRRTPRRRRRTACGRGGSPPRRRRAPRSRRRSHPPKRLSSSTRRSCNEPHAPRLLEGFRRGGRGKLKLFHPRQDHLIDPLELFVGIERYHQFPLPFGVGGQFDHSSAWRTDHFSARIFSAASSWRSSLIPSRVRTCPIESSSRRTIC